MDFISELERKYGFTVPSAYRSFAERGYMTYPGNAYLWVSEAEWIRPIDMVEQREIPAFAKPGLVAFAFTGSGSLWAWQTRQVSEAGEPAIVFCPSDCNDGWSHAPSFLGWFYRMSLEYASRMWDGEATTKQHLQTWVSVLREFGRHEWAADVKAIAERTPVETQFGQQRHFSLIGEVEVNERIRSAFGGAFVDAPYRWTVEDGY